MTCADIELRLYDEDCRAALHGRSDVPRDVSVHIARCERCREVWSEAKGEMRHLAERLLADSPVEVRTALYSAFAAYRPARPSRGLLWADLASHAIVAAALGASLLPAVLPLAVSAGAGFFIGAAFGAGLHALRRAGIEEWTPRWPWRHVGRWLPSLVRIGG